MRIPEQQFIRACRNANSVAEVARMLDMDRKGVIRRIKRLEGKHGNLHPNPQPSNEAIKLSHDSDRPYSAVLFADAHFWPEYLCPRPRSMDHLVAVVKKLQPDLIINMGDSFDGFSISRHPPHGWIDGPSVIEEIEANRAYLKEISDAARDAELYYIWGNHDARFDSYLSMNAQQFRGVSGTRLPDHFPDWKFCESLMLNDTLYCKHSWHGGMYAARNNTLKAGKSIATGHLHKQRVIPYTDLTGTRYGIEVGTLADPSGPQFFYTNGNPLDWQQGFVVITVDRDHITTETVDIIDGEAVWRGKRL